MKNEIHEPRICPKCGQSYTERSAISRADNETLICPDCGTREALTSLGVGADEQEKILGILHRSHPITDE